jgi:hypothetical protein
MSTIYLNRTASAKNQLLHSNDQQKWAEVDQADMHSRRGIYLRGTRGNIALLQAAFVQGWFEQNSNPFLYFFFVCRCSHDIVANWQALVVCEVRSGYPNIVSALSAASQEHRLSSVMNFEFQIVLPKFTSPCILT